MKKLGYQIYVNIELREDGYHEACVADAPLGPLMVGVARSEGMAVGFALQKYATLMLNMFQPTSEDFERTNR